MAKNCIGLDLGSSAVKVTQVKKKGNGFTLLNFGIEPIPPDTIVDGAILNHSGVVEAVRALFERLKIKQKEVALAISGNALIIKTIFVPAFTRDVTTGGNSFTDDIKRHLGVSGEEAEALKVAFTDGDASADVARILQMTSSQMAGEFQKSIDFFLASHPDTSIGKIYLSGG